MYQSDAKILAGGQSLIPIMKLRLASPSHIIDITRIPDLAYIRESNQKIFIGALTNHHEIEKSELIRERCSVMVETASWIADPQVRNLGTIGGSLAHADPAGDWGATIIAVRACLKAVGPSGERRIDCDSFFKDVFTTDLESDELLTEIEVPTFSPRSGGAYLKLERKAGDFAIVGVSVQLSFDSTERCSYAGIGVTGVSSTPVRAKEAESRLRGKSIDELSISEAAKAASSEFEPLSDNRSPSEYRKAMIGVLTTRALKLAALRSKAVK
jgi:carbon-monoxide dehydrogenase medium subunit